MDPLSTLKIPGALQPLPDKSPADAARLLRQLRPAQLLLAVVLGRPAPGLARLRIGNAAVDARTPESIATGEKLLLRVEKGLPDPLLRIIDAPARAPIVQRLQRHAMSRQLPPAEMSRQAQALQRQMQGLPDGAARRLPLLEQGLRILSPPGTDITRLSSAEIQRAVQNSGLFMEALLGAKKEVPEGDRKLLLLRLLDLLRPERRSGSAVPAGQDKGQRGEPPAGTDQMLNRLMRLVEGGIARIQHHQTLSLVRTDPGEPLLWQFDLPIQVNDRREHLGLKIQQESAQDDATQAGSAWKVELRFDFHELGEVLSRITLRGKSVHCAFWSEKASTASRFERALPQLQQALQGAGLDVSAISALHGRPPAEERCMSRMLDERA